MDEPGIIGSRWWNEGMIHQEVVGRRTAVFAMLAGAGVMIGGIALGVEESGSDDVKYEDRQSLQMQRTYGWNFGATDQRVVFNPIGAGFPRALLAEMVTALGPSVGSLTPFFVPTLFQSPLATPTTELWDDPWVSHPVGDELEVSVTPEMTVAYDRGDALALLFNHPPKHVAVILDLPGADTVAFAAGAANAFTPVFAIDNWPHPRGVVPAHLTLAAAAKYQNVFTQAASARSPDAPPMFILDRNRLTPYVDSSTQFDNRHLARLPSAANLSTLGIKYVLYICPSSWSVAELDDLNEDFVGYAASGITVRALGADAFVAGSGDGTTYFYGGSSQTSAAFWTDYPWDPSAPKSTFGSGVQPGGRAYVPTKRVTAFSFASSGSHAPANFGTVPVVLALASGAILGAKMSRSGSWNRGSSGG